MYSIQKRTKFTTRNTVSQNLQKITNRADFGKRAKMSTTSHIIFLYNIIKMGGGLLQLVAYGAQDIYLTGNPQITYFKIVYRRHTNFAMESIEQTFNGTADWNRKVTCTISRNGDLIHRVYLQVTLPAVTIPLGNISSSMKARWCNWVGHKLIKNVNIEIGGQQVDKHYGEWLHIWNELTQTAGHQTGYANMVGNVPALTNVFDSSGATYTFPETTLFVPLQFWFCRNPGLALPLIALQYHEVRINLEFEDKANLFWYSLSGTATAPTVPAVVSASLWVDYIYLDTDERRRMAQVSHEYLIEQLQFTGSESTSADNYKAKLSFNHPCKEFIWTAQPQKNADRTMTSTVGGPQWFNFSDDIDTSFDNGIVNGELGLGYPTSAFAGLSASAQSSLKNPILSAKLQLNGHDRMALREGRYFNLVQPYQHHENVPSAGINVYSFALKPEEHQPSGTLNASRIDSCTLSMNFASSSSRWVNVYAVNYNVLRIMSGMGGLAYAN